MSSRRQRPEQKSSHTKTTPNHQWHVWYLGDDDDLASLCIHCLHDSQDRAIANHEPTHQPRAAHCCHTLIVDGEEDVGLRLGATLGGDLRSEKQWLLSAPAMLESPYHPTRVRC